MNHFLRIVGLAVATMLLGNALAQTSPNPYRVQTGWGNLPDGRQFGVMTGAFPDPDGLHMWIVDRCGGNQCVGNSFNPIMKFDLDGNLIERFGADLFAFPHGVAFDPDGYIWISEGGSHGDVRATEGERQGKGHQVFKMTMDGEVVMTIGEAGIWGDDYAHFNGPSGVAIAADGSVWITDGHRGGNNRLMKYAADGTFLLAIGEGKICGPSACSDVDGNPLPADRNVGGVGTESKEPAAFSDPHDVKIDHQGRVLAVDRGNSRIQVFSQQGELLEIWTHYGKPSGVFVDQNNVLYAGDGLSGMYRDTAPDRWRSNLGWEKGIRIGSLDVEQAWVTYFIPQHREDAGPYIEFLGVDFNGTIYAGDVARQELVRFLPYRPTVFSSD